MQKKIIALAIASLSGAAFAQSNVTIYGAMRASVDKISNAVGNDTGWTVSDRASRIGFKGAEDLGGGLKAVWQWESNLNSTQTGDLTTNYGPIQNATTVGQRNTFLGLSGGFGTALIGTHDTPYKLAGSADLFGDTAADAQCNATFADTTNTTTTNATCIIGRNGFDNRLSNVIAYISPTWSGFHFAAAGVAGENTRTDAANRANGLTDAYSLAAIYANGPIKATLGHEKRSAKFVGATGSANAKSANGTKLNLGYTIGAIGLGYTYERSTSVNDENTAGVSRVKDKAHLASVSYAMGATTLGLQYGKFNDNGNISTDVNPTSTDLTTWTVGAYHNLSKRTQAYAAYHKGRLGGADALNAAGNANGVGVLTMGLNHSF